jgi:hypothetical protein
MKVTGIITHNGLPVVINEYNMAQLIFQHKDGKTQILLTTVIDGEPLTFQQGDIQELQIIQITNADFNKDYDKEAKMIMEKIVEKAYDDGKNKKLLVKKSNTSKYTHYQE